MKVLGGVAELTETYGASSVVTIGNFDGVHLGHQELIKTAVGRARELGLPAVVFTFEPHPLMVLKPELKLRRLFDIEDRREQFERLGVDTLVVEPFSRDFSQQPPEVFLRDFILRPFQPKAIVVGYDFSFGANRTGSIEFLRSQAALLGARDADGAHKTAFEVEVVPPFSLQIGGSPTVVSSTRIRQLLSAGQAEDAATLLGRPYCIRGRVKKGKGRGKTIGIPTANIDPTVESNILPGVYAAYAHFRRRKEKALVNIGRNPTFEVDSKELHIEAHLPEYDGAVDGDLYGEFLELHFVSRIRAEKKFSSADELVMQIRTDIAAGVGILK